MWAAASRSAVESMIWGGRPLLAQAGHMVRHSIVFSTARVTTRTPADSAPQDSHRCPSGQKSVR